MNNNIELDDPHPKLFNYIFWKWSAGRRSARVSAPRSQSARRAAVPGIRISSPSYVGAYKLQLLRTAARFRIGMLRVPSWASATAQKKEPGCPGSIVIRSTPSLRRLVAMRSTFYRCSNLIANLTFQLFPFLKQRVVPPLFLLDRATKNSFK
jgi:hypothetical protein